MTMITVIPFIAMILSQISTTDAQMKGGTAMKIMVLSTSFRDGEMIPKKYTCDGEDMSSPLSWSGIPEGTKSIAIVSDDRDAPAGTWVHWVAYNIPPEYKGIPENLAKEANIPGGGMHGVTDFRKVGYGVPCPPKGTHRYFFKVYALDTVLSELRPGATKQRLLMAMEGHILAEGELVGKYRR